MAKKGHWVLNIIIIVYINEDKYNYFGKIS